MFNIDEFIRDSVKELVPYQVPKREAYLKLDAMENPYNLPEEIIHEVCKEIERLDFNRYPNPVCEDLRRDISKNYHVPVESIIVGNGSDEIILNLLLCYGGEGCKVLYPYPTFEVYGIISKMLGIKTEEIFLDENFQIDPEKFINQGKGNIIFISYPNNPTGNHFNREDIKRIIEENSSLVVVDEAYYGFTRESFLNELNNYKNLLILRTFSKMFSLASLRIGFLFGDPDIVSNIMKVKLPYNVNSFSQMMARIILSKEEHFIERAKEIIKERERMYKALEKIEKITPYSSQANFILFRVEDNHCDYVFESLKKEKILVRCFKNIPPISDCLRVSIGSREENIKFINCLEDIISKV